MIQPNGWASYSIRFDESVDFLGGGKCGLEPFLFEPHPCCIGFSKPRGREYATYIHHD